MPFLEERISIDIRLGASYQDDYAVEITKVASDAEYPRLIHPFPVRHFTVSYQKERSDMYASIVNMYHRVYGSYAGFRAKCIDDFTTNNYTAAPTHLDQTLVSVSATVFQLVKEYGTDKTGLPTIGRPKRTLFKPVAGTVLIGVGGTLVSSGFTIDNTTGLVTFASAPGGLVTGGCEFDIPVRFVTPITITQNHKTSRYLGDIELIELLNP